MISKQYIGLKIDYLKTVLYASIYFLFKLKNKTVDICKPAIN